MRNKKAFTMVELIMVVTIISFIVIVELIILNNKINEYGQPYFTAYNALKKASYNVLADMYCPNKNSPDPECQIGPREFPLLPNKLCSRVAEFINTSKNFCEDNEITSASEDHMYLNYPNFVASNSFKFYFGPMAETEVEDNYGNKTKLQYFVVYVDINGEKRPNRATCDTTNLMPDVVPFAITRRGEVIPMGLPVYSKLYLTAKIKYPTSISATTGEAEDKTSASLSFYEAVFGAWPKEGTDEVQRSLDIPFSILISDDDIYEGSIVRQCYDGTIPGLRTEFEYKSDAVSREALGCKGGTYSCRVTIDSSQNARW